MKAGPDASIRDLFSKSRHVGPAVGHAGSGRAGHRDFGNVLASERRRNDTGDGAAQDAMRARIFRMHRRIVDRLPGRVTLCGWIIVNIAVANSGDWSPEVIVILGLEKLDQRIVEATR